MKSAVLIFFCLILCVAPWVLSAPQARPSTIAQTLKKDWTWELRLNALLSGTYQKYSEDETNFKNKVLQKPNSYLQLELQPTINIKSNHIPIRWIAKPKLKGRQTQVTVLDQTSDLAISEYGFWENYLSLEIASSFEVSVGIVNLQWGPSEVINPSQFLLSDQTLITEPYQFYQGIEMAQALWTPSQNISVNIVKELKSFEWNHSDDLTFSRKRKFYDRALVRAEYSSSNGALTAGQVVGNKNSDQWRMQYGGYALWNYTDWTQIYTDYMMQRGSEVNYWDGTSLQMDYANSSDVFYTAVVGHRLTFENGPEWKAEWITNTFGKTRDEMQTERRALRLNPANLIALAAYYQREYIFPGQNYLYNSLRWDNPQWLGALFDTSTIYLRDLVAIDDQSHFINFEFQSSLSDQWSQALGVVKTVGEKDAELNAELDAYFSYVVRRSF